jgi:Uncharacterized conserved domain (SAYSvFN)
VQVQDYELHDDVDVPCAASIMVGPPTQSGPRKLFQKVGVDKVVSTGSSTGRDAVEEDMDANDDMQGPHVTELQRQIGHWLQIKCHVPSAALAIFYLLSLRAWGAVLVRSPRDWLVCAITARTMHIVEPARSKSNLVTCLCGHCVKTHMDVAASVRHLFDPDGVCSAVQYLLTQSTLQVWMWWARWAAHYDFGALYVGVSMILLMVCNLGRRKPGEASAYSLFNDGFRRLPGDFTNEQIDNAFRGRM